MPSEVTARVRKYRERRALVRVEVEVPTIEDASAVRQFARQRRDAARRAADSSKVIRVQHQAEPDEALGVLLDAVGPDAIPALRIFIAGLAQAHTPSLIERAERVAANFTDAATRQARAGLIGGDERAGA